MGPCALIADLDSPGYGGEGGAALVAGMCHAISRTAATFLECGGSDAALDDMARLASQSGVAATLCHRTPKQGTGQEPLARHDAEIPGREG